MTLGERIQLGYGVKQQGESKQKDPNQPHQPRQRIALDLMSVEMGKGRFVSEYI